jgi:hypothetical protein
VGTAAISETGPSQPPHWSSVDTSPSPAFARLRNKSEPLLVPLVWYTDFLKDETPWHAIGINKCARESEFDRKNFIRKLVRDMPVKRNSYDEFLRWLQGYKSRTMS